MKLSEAIALVDRLKPNQFERELKIQWLSRIDGLIYREVISTHSGSAISEFEGYDINTDVQTELLVPYPYDEDIYNSFLQGMIAKENGEMAKYNQAITIYNNAFKLFCDWYNRTHTPIPTDRRFIF